MKRLSRRLMISMIQITTASNLKNRKQNTIEWSNWPRRKNRWLLLTAIFFLFLCVVFVVVVELRVWCSSSARANRSCDEILWGYSPLFTYTWRDDSVIANRVWLHYHGPLTAQFTHWMTESNCRKKRPVLLVSTKCLEPAIAVVSESANVKQKGK